MPTPTPMSTQQTFYKKEIYFQFWTLKNKNFFFQKYHQKCISVGIGVGIGQQYEFEKGRKMKESASASALVERSRKEKKIDISF